MMIKAYKIIGFFILQKNKKNRKYNNIQDVSFYFFGQLLKLN